MSQHHFDHLAFGQIHVHGDDGRVWNVANMGRQMCEPAVLSVVSDVRLDYEAEEAVEWQSG